MNAVQLVKANALKVMILAIPMMVKSVVRKVKTRSGAKISAYLLKKIAVNIMDYAPQTTENTAVPVEMITSTLVSMVNPMNSKVQDVAILKILRVVALKLTMNGVKRQKNANGSAHVKDVAISTAVMNSITSCTELMMNST